MLVWRVGFLYRRYGLWPYDFKTLVALVVGAVAVLAVHFTPSLGSTVMDLLLRGAVATVVFWPAAYMFGLIPDIVELLGKAMAGTRPAE